MSVELPPDVAKCPTCIERKNRMNLTPLGWSTYHRSDHGRLPDAENIKVGKRAPAAEEINSEWREYP